MLKYSDTHIYIYTIFEKITRTYCLWFRAAGCWNVRFPTTVPDTFYMITTSTYRVHKHTYERDYHIYMATHTHTHANRRIFILHRLKCM